MPEIRGASGSLTAAIGRIERRDRDLWPGGIARAFESWRRRSWAPDRLLLDICPCGCDAPGESRDLLERAVHRLPRRSARELRTLLAEIDDRFERRTYPDPHAPPGSWWDRRCVR